MPYNHASPLWSGFARAYRLGLQKGRRVVEKNAGLAAHFVRPVDPVYGRCVAGWSARKLADVCNLVYL